MKRIEIFNRFDAVMSNLKQLEPSPAFEFEFRRRLKEAISKKYEETFLDKFYRRTAEGIENLRYALLPRAPVLVRSAVIFASIFFISIYMLSIQPSGPILTSKEGIVMVWGAKGGGWQEARLAYRLSVGDVIATREGSQLDLTLSNKYAVRIKENAKIEVAKLTPRFGKGEVSFELIKGKMLASVEEGFRGSSFTVNTKTATAKALGTKFSVDVDKDDRSKTSVSVLEGKVAVKSLCKTERLLLAKQDVMVGSGQKTEVYLNEPPLQPHRLVEKEWDELSELYQIGRKLKVILLIKNTPDRAMQLLAPCPIYISDEKPREIPKIFEDAVLKIEQAIKTKNKTAHIESIKLLERLVSEHPNPKYNVQFLLYIGSYYEYLGLHYEAVSAFEKVIKNYPDSSLASIAQCAIGIIYGEKLNDIRQADEAFKLVLTKYPNSLEAIWVRDKKARDNIEQRPS